MSAYRVQDFQVIGGPAWIDNDRFDVQAKAEDGAIPETRNSRDERDKLVPLEFMMQSMLTDQFQLNLSRETRDLPVYTLSIAKDGAKIKAAAADSAEPEPRKARGDALVQGARSFGTESA
ncbi:MAG TPA: TIGR03435 family protein [Terriglobia bacterium]|jgi:uncharacterized protein (TIGR03435 family)